MTDDQTLRQHVRALLTERQAHASFEDAVRDFPPDRVNERPDWIPYSAYALLEHLRFTQRDILNFLREPDYRAPDWPKDYWPHKGEQASPDDWQAAVQGFQDDHAALVKLLDDPGTELETRIPWGEGQTPLREFLLVADHNAYHLGELVLLRRLLGAWKS